MIRNISLIAILLMAFLASVSLAGAQDSSSDEGAFTINDTVDTSDASNAAQTAENNETAENTPTASAGQQGVQGIWKAMLGEKEIIMAVNQSTGSLFGLAKFEGEDPWNGALAGTLSSNAVSFSLAAMEGEALASTYISASLEGDSMIGFFIRSDSNGKASRGDFSATMISPDTTSYTPAAVRTAPLPTVQEEQASSEQKTEATAAQESEEPADAESESRFKDVTKLAKGINPDILPRMAPL